MMNAQQWQLADETATLALGEALGRALMARKSESQPAAALETFTVFLQGDLGAGKTTFSRGLLRAFGHSGPVKSPTYTLVETYDLSDGPVHHFDLYRLGDPEELEYMGIRDYFAPGGVCLLEWPERGAGVLPEADLQVKVSVSGTGRLARLSAGSDAGQSVLAAVARSHSIGQGKTD